MSLVRLTDPYGDPMYVEGSRIALVEEEDLGGSTLTLDLARTAQSVRVLETPDEVYAALTPRWRRERLRTPSFDETLEAVLGGGKSAGAAG